MATVLTTRGRAMRKLAMVMAQFGAAILLCVAWEQLAASGTINAFVVGTPSRILDNLTTWISDGSLMSNAAVTLVATFVGYGAALTIGVAVGTAAGTVPAIGRAIGPFITFWQGFPRLVFYPFFAVALGYSISSRMVHVAFVIVFVIIVSTAAGVADVDDDVKNHARMVGASRWALLRDTRLPAAVLWIGTSARVTFGFAIQAAIVAEFTGASSGLGYLMVLGQNSFDINVVWAAAVTVIVVAVAVDLALQAVQRYFSRWQVSS